MGRVVYRLRADVVEALLGRRHMTATEGAAALGVSRSYFSQLLAGKRALSPKVRRRLLANAPFSEIPSHDLWTSDADVGGTVPMAAPAPALPVPVRRDVPAWLVEAIGNPLTYDAADPRRTNACVRLDPDLYRRIRRVKTRLDLRTVAGAWEYVLRAGLAVAER